MIVCFNIVYELVIVCIIILIRSRHLEQGIDRHNLVMPSFNSVNACYK
jgi:hypothetical protein